MAGPGLVSDNDGNAKQKFGISFGVNVNAKLAIGFGQVFPVDRQLDSMDKIGPVRSLLLFLRSISKTWWLLHVSQSTSCPRIGGRQSSGFHLPRGHRSMTPASMFAALGFRKTPSPCRVKFADPTRAITVAGPARMIHLACRSRFSAAIPEGISSPVASNLAGSIRPRRTGNFCSRRCLISENGNRGRAFCPGLSARVIISRSQFAREAAMFLQCVCNSFKWVTRGILINLGPERRTDMPLCYRLALGPRSDELLPKRHRTTTEDNVNIRYGL